MTCRKSVATAQQSSISGHSDQMSKISGQLLISGQFQDNCEISGISGQLGALHLRILTGTMCNRKIDLEIKYHLLQTLSAAYTDALLEFLDLFVRITIIMLTVMPRCNHLVPLHLFYCGY